MKAHILAIIVTILMATTIFLFGYKMENELISRKTLFGNPDKVGVQISHDGKYISYLQDYDGYLNIYFAPTDNPEKSERLTNDKRGIRSYFWSYDNEHVLYLQDKDGNENWHIFKKNIHNGDVVNLTPFDGVRASIDKLSKNFPDQIIISLNKRTPAIFDLYTLNIKTGELSLIYENKEEFSSFMLNDEFKLKLAEKKDQETGDDLYYTFDEELKTSHFWTIPSEDVYTSSFLTFNKDFDKVYLVNSAQKDIGDLELLDLKTKKSELIFSTKDREISNILFNKIDKTPIAIELEQAKAEWLALDQSFSQDLSLIKEKAKGKQVIFTSSNYNQTKWVIAFLASDGPVEYYLYDREKKHLQFLFHNQKALLNIALQEMQPVEIETRDGIILHSYLTLPEGFKIGKSSPVPLIMYVHGGPTVRDNWGYNPTCQWLANRGYAVLQVNYRGSTGFGKKFANLGRGEWGAKMHDDLIDAAEWSIKEKITSKDKIAIFGGSYGGYATLVGLTFTPDYFACGVDIVGPSNLVTLLESIPPYWKPAMKELELRTGGDIKTERGREFLKSRSPLTFADRIKKPLLILQGANDPRVKQAEADQIVDAMKQNNIDVTYVIYPDEGHGFAKPENRISYIAITEQFLSKCLGGKSEAITDELDKSSAKISEDSFNLIK